mmetsp:Transcript_17792/g.50923  ORF Transcript_17792/g.50923 Transcript_17792/m.50923 type:complete len:310 (-) Transcript_17792:1776-2705(-)
MVDTLVVVNLGKLLPSDVEDVPSRLPLSIFLAQTLDNHWNCHRRIFEEQIKHLFSGITVDPNDCVPVDDSQGALVEGVLELLPGETRARSSGTVLLLCCGEEFWSDQFLVVELSNLLGDRLKTEQRGGIAVDAHVNLEALVFDAEKKLLVLILSHMTEGVGLLRSDGEGNPNVVQDLLLHHAALAAGRGRVVPGKSSIAGTAPAAATEVNLRQRHGVPGIVAKGATGNASIGQNALELFEELNVALTEQGFDESQHFAAGEDLLRIHIKTFEELGPSLATVARVRSEGLLRGIEKLALHAGVVDVVGRR